jgi:hypothetical protein
LGVGLPELMICCGNAPVQGLLTLLADGLLGVGLPGLMSCCGDAHGLLTLLEDGLLPRLSLLERWRRERDRRDP